VTDEDLSRMIVLLLKVIT